MKKGSNKMKDIVLNDYYNKLTKNQKKKHAGMPKRPLLFRTENGILCFAVCVMKAGSCAILRREPCQVLTEAAVSACGDVLQG